jgi:DnaJ-class molecular chaperone
MTQRDPRAAIAEFVDRAYPALDQIDYYRMLGVSSAATERDIRAAYYGLAARLHPDVHGEEIAAEFRTKLTAVYSRVVEAYKVLSDGPRRQQYDAALAGGDMRLKAGAKARPKAATDQISNASAKRFFQLGISALHDRNGNSAVTNFRLALSMEPDNDLIKQKLAEAERLLKG